MEKLNLVIITGLSGAGKSVSMNFFEDYGFFCIDNLPPLLIDAAVNLFLQPWCEIKKVTLVMDIREKIFFDTLITSLNKIKEKNVEYKLLFIDASDEILVQRYRITRRAHPLQSTSIEEAIVTERKRLRQLRELADIYIDTSDLSPQQLCEILTAQFSKILGIKKLHITLLTFSYKDGVPPQADLVFDLRFLPNPYYVKELQPLSGANPQVIDFLLQKPQTKEFLSYFFKFIDFLIPQYIREGKSYITIALGCTGGKHRSVSIATILNAHLKETLSAAEVDVEVKQRG